MYICKCGRNFTTPQGLGKHKTFCGKNKISLDNGYEYFIDKDGKVKYIHIMVMEEELGRKLLPGEIVHHKDENKRNNDKNNLELTCPKDHGKHHIKVLSDSQKKERFRKIQILEKEIIIQ
jgi:hypothetical protein